VRSAIGAQITAYGVADALKPIYSPNGSSRPSGFNVFVRFRPFSGSER
jgi:hypothetical protein